jgi:uncharacterized protein YcaQ
VALARLDNRAARRLFLARHGLADVPAGPGKGADLLSVISDLGFVQVDSINTVARAHDMILFARRPRFRPAFLKALYERQGALFEHWTHDAAMIPRAFFPHWHLRFARDAEVLKRQWAQWRRDGYEARFEPVLRHIRDHGPVRAADVGAGETRASGGWWDWHPSKTALEYLWRVGALSVVGRDGFQKRYDLTERVIEAHLQGAANSPDPDETIDWLCDAALDRLGFATPGEIAAFWATVTPAEAQAWTALQRAAGRLAEIEIAGADGAWRRVFARPDAPARADALAAPTGRLRVLSPFDPALRDRKRAERLFGFHYRIEIFTPAAKRRYGYYVFPILEGDSLVGRIDMQADRKAGRLVVRALWPEAGMRWGKARQKRLEAELARVARFAGTGDPVFGEGWLRPA